MYLLQSTIQTGCILFKKVRSRLNGLFHKYRRSLKEQCGNKRKGSGIEFHTYIVAIISLGTSLPRVIYSRTGAQKSASLSLFSQLLQTLVKRNYESLTHFRTAPRLYNDVVALLENETNAENTSRGHTENHY